VARGAGSRREVFARLDDQAVGSHIKMGGQAFGLAILVDEVVVERHPPSRKVWRTTGTTRLVVIGDYEMGFEVSPASQGPDLRVWIDYDPPLGPARWPSGLGALYARWCVRQMVGDAVRHFAPAGVRRSRGHANPRPGRPPAPGQSPGP
jgi:hypothetical protein